MSKNLLRVERYLQNLRQVDLAAMTSIPQTRISRIENGQVNPSDDEKQRLAKAFGLSLSDLWPS